MTGQHHLVRIDHEVRKVLSEKSETILIEKLKAHSFDIVQLEGVFMATYIPVIKKYSNAKIVLRSHNVEHQIWERHLVLEKNLIKKTYLSCNEIK